MKTRIVLVTLLTLLISPGVLFAQNDERAPGMYAVVGEQSVLLKQSFGGTTSGDESVMGMEVGSHQYRYKGMTSGFTASDTFIFVTNPEEKKTTNPFFKNKTPEDVAILPLYVNKDDKRREYDTGMSVQGYNVDKLLRVDFHWKRISDNSFEIKLDSIAPGEYAFVFRAGSLSPFLYSRIISFTIPETKQ